MVCAVYLRLREAERELEEDKWYDRKKRAVKLGI